MGRTPLLSGLRSPCRMRGRSHPGSFPPTTELGNPVLDREQASAESPPTGGLGDRRTRCGVERFLDKEVFVTDGEPNYQFLLGDLRHIVLEVPCLQ